jgi:stage II sporulation protein GA (sporulation sigma-E factor processing peptidase)
VNTIINAAILITAGRIVKRRAGTIRLMLSSFTGSLFSLTIFFGLRSLILSVLIRLASTVMIALIAYGYDSFKELSKISLAILTVSAVFSGMMTALYQLCRPPNMLIVNDVVYFEIDPVVLIGITGVIYVILLLIERLLRERIHSTVVRLSFTVGGIDYQCPGKIDTGCSLTEPFSGSAVIVADRSLFPLPDDMAYRVIPYTTVGGSSVLYAVKAERVAVDDRIINQDIYIASGDIRNDNYRAVINSEILR